ncbi:hypothetical protein HYU15_02830 [Candidatus Woesearchaeota archaeon]|nr:hypothetical protein [Candidatus Woesearchaeota archaeon]
MKIKPEEFEKLLTQEGMHEAEEWIAYLATRIDRGWHEQLLRNMQQTKGHPLSNAAYLHEIVESQHILARGKTQKT